MSYMGFNTRDFIFGSRFDRFDRFDRRFEPEPTQDEGPSDELAQKQQRAAVQSKRHKQRMVHIQTKKDVPQILKNFVNKSK